MFNEDRLQAHWSAVDAMSEAEFCDRLDPLLAAAPAAIAAFERACAHDTFGHPALAVALYRQALDIGLEGERR